MHRFFPPLRTFGLILFCLWPLGCATSPPTHFYLLSPLPAADSETGTPQKEDLTVIRVDAVVIPGYLDRHEIVTRVSENEIHLADLNQWGEPMRDGLTNILAVNLSRLLPAGDFAVFPFKSPSPVDYQISVEIIRMDGRLNGEVHLAAQWSILEGNEGDILFTRKTRFKASETPTDYDELVAALSRLVEDLSREIAERLRATI